MQKLMFYCQYIFGMGHLVRSLEIVRALARDFEVTFVTGGDPVAGLEVPPNVNLVRLPALEAEPGFQGVRPCDPAIDLAETRELRKRQLLALFEKLRPEVLVVELFPFGRKQFSFELTPLVERARESGALVACSLRDILVRKQNQAAHEQRVCEIANACFDLVLVHGDPALVTLEETFSRAGDLRCELRYTGYVVRSAPKVPAMPRGGGRSMIGSIGGGRSEEGRRLLEALIGAAALLQDRLPHQFRIYAGPFMPEDAYARLSHAAAGARNIQLRKYTPGLISELAAADLSVSLGGYNTTMDILRAGVPALVLPAEDSGDREQALRTAKLERLGAIQPLDPACLTAPELAGRIERALAGKPRRIRLDLNGAENTRALLSALSRAPRARGVGSLTHA
jgi:predicted glycosyltransferase